MRLREYKNRRIEPPQPPRDPERAFRIRLTMVTVVFSLLTVAVIARSTYLQVFLHQDLTERAVAQYQKQVYLAPSRGMIYDRRGREMAVNVDTYSVYAVPGAIKEKSRAAGRLAATLDVSAAKLEGSLANRRGFMWIKRQVTPTEARAVKEMGIEGLGLYTESRRFYPHRDLASQVIGFAGVDSQGLEGIEYQYDRHLKGNAGWLMVQRDALDRPVFVDRYQDDPENRGEDLTLTIDRNIQFFAQEEIRRAVEEAGAKEGMVIVMDPVSGEILAMAQAGYFNPNRAASRDEETRRNICLTHLFEPGSTMKPFILATALEEGTATLNSVFNCGNGSITIYGKTIEDVHPYGALTAREIIAKSSNVGAIRIGQTLKRERLHQGLSAFGFGRPTGVDLPGESRGILHPPSQWSGMSQPALSFGHEIGVTPLQMTVAYAAIASGGMLTPPSVVRSLTRDGRTEVPKREAARRVISSKTAADLRDALRQAVTDGTAKAAAIPGYTVAGKTGTAKKVDAAAGGYASGKYLSSFVGFVPAHDPAVVILVMVDEPVGAYYGGSVAAPVFARAGERILHYLAVPPDNPQELMPRAEGARRVDAG
jgi:cell division protein FtsI (penicillin-binding protein 3)